MDEQKELSQRLCEQLFTLGDVRYKAMFGGYIVYINDKPIITICSCIPYVKIVDDIKEEMKNAKIEPPYICAKEHYVLDIDNVPLMLSVIEKLEKVIPVPKKHSKKK